MKDQIEIFLSLNEQVCVGSFVSLYCTQDYPINMVQISSGHIIIKRLALTPCALGAGLNCLRAKRGNCNFGDGQNYGQELVLAP